MSLIFITQTNHYDDIMTNTTYWTICFTHISRLCRNFVIIDNSLQYNKLCHFPIFSFDNIAFLITKLLALISPAQGNALIVKNYRQWQTMNVDVTYQFLLILHHNKCFRTKPHWVYWCIHHWIQHLVPKQQIASRMHSTWHRIITFTLQHLSLNKQCLELKANALHCISLPQVVQTTFINCSNNNVHLYNNLSCKQPDVQSTNFLALYLVYLSQQQSHCKKNRHRNLNILRAMMERRLLRKHEVVLDLSTVCNQNISNGKCSFSIVVLHLFMATIVSMSTHMTTHRGMIPLEWPHRGMLNYTFVTPTIPGVFTKTHRGM